MPIPEFLARLRQKVVHELILVPTVVVIARHPDGRLLMVHDNESDAWTLPGGIMEPAETPAEAVLRELFEETGMSATLTRIVAVIGGPGCETTYRNGDRLAWVATVFAASLGDGTPTPDGVETRDARLLTAEALALLDIRADSRRFLAAEHHHPRSAHFDLPAGRQPGT